MARDTKGSTIRNLKAEFWIKSKLLYMIGVDFTSFLLTHLTRIIVSFKYLLSPFTHFLR